MGSKRQAAYHTDVEEMASKLDNMVVKGKEIGVHYFLVEAAAEKLRQLSNMSRGLEKALEKERAGKDDR